MAAGVLLVHEARWRLPGSEPQSIDGGHDYVGVLAALTGVALALAMGQLAYHWACREPDRGGGYAGRVRLAMLATAAVLCGYAGQELLAGWLAPGHPIGLPGVLEQDGWVALPLAVAVGSVIAFVLCGATAILRRRSELSRSRERKAILSGVRYPRDVRRVTEALFARHLGGRSPPPHLLAD